MNICNWGIGFRSGIASVALAICIVSPQSAEAQSNKTISIEQWEQDVDTLVSELPKKHVDFFSKLEQKEFEAAANLIRRDLKSGELKSDRVPFELMKLVALGKDGHTALALDRSGFHYIPLNFVWLEDGLFVSAADKSNSNLVGAKVVRFGKLTTPEYQEKLSEYIATENEYWFRNVFKKQCNTVEYLRHCGACNGLDKIELEFEKDKKPFKKSFNTITAGSRIDWTFGGFEFPLHMRKQNLNYWNDWLPGDKTLYFKYNRCQDGIGFAKLVNGTIGFVRQNDVDRFVLDLRDNAGGNSAIFRPLLEYLKTNEQLNQKDKLFVIIGRGTFSSGLWNAIEMKQTNATFVGEPTGGRPNHFGEVRSFKLPHSKLEVFYSTRRWDLLEDSDPDSFEPDIRVEINSKDYFQGKDPFLEAALKQ